MDENREQIPADQQEHTIEPVQEPVQETAQEPVQETAQEPAAEEQLAAEAQRIFDARAQMQTGSKTVYSWDYEHQRANDLGRNKSKKGNVGVWIYALLATGALALCLGLVVGVLIYAMLGGVGNTVVQGGLAGDVTVVGGGDEQTLELSALESVRNYTVVISARSDDGMSTGTGFVLTQDGYIVTNYHVIEGMHTITVKFYNGQAAIAQVVGYSQIDDIAVIKVQANGLYIARIGSSAAVKDAQNVYAVGTPAGEEYAWSVTKGLVSFVQREVKIYDDEGILVKKMQLIQTDTPVNPGNSGGPLVNTNGEVIGIITLKLSGQYENMGFAIPIDGAMVLINNIIRTGEPGESPITTKRPLIGIVGVGVEAGKYYINVAGENRIEEVTKEYADAHPGEVFYAAYSGVWVQSTTPGMDATNKLKPNDIIVMADGQELATIYDLMDVINEHNGGETVQLTYYRNGVAHVVDVELGYAE